MGSTALLQCQAEQSNPAPIITWEKDRELLTSDGAHVIILPSGNLYIVGVKPGDAGLYRCIATNSVTSTARHSMEAELVVGEWVGVLRWVLLLGSDRLHFHGWVVSNDPIGGRTVP